MESENSNVIKEGQAESFSEKPSYEQQQLEAIYNGFKEQLEKFFCDCKKQIQGSARACREAESTIKVVQDENEKLKCKKSAWELLDGLGYAFAWLYKTVEAIPDEVCAKKELLNCLQNLNAAFGNFGIHPIYELSHGEYQDKNRYELVVCTAQDRSQVGMVEMDKMGFEIEGEGIIKAQYVEYAMNKNFKQDGDRLKGEISSCEQFPFIYDKDFYIERDYYGREYIKIISSFMLDKFNDNIDLNGKDYIYLHAYYSLKNVRKIRDNTRISDKKLSRLNAVYLDIKSGSLYLYLVENITCHGKNKFEKLEEICLTTIR